MRRTKQNPEPIRTKRYTDHADVWVLVNEGAQEVHLLVQVRPPYVANSLTCETLCAILTTHSVLLQLSAMSETHARLVSVQTCPSSDPT
jgi:hypothetical protein